MNYNHLKINERAYIYELKNLGMSVREIAKALNRNLSTISREIKMKNDIINEYITNCSLDLTNYF